MPFIIPAPIAVDNVTLQQSAAGVVSIKNGGVANAQVAAAAAIAQSKLAAGAIQGPILGGTNTNPGAGATQYVPINDIDAFAGNEVSAEVDVPYAATLKNLRVRNRGATAALSSTVFTVRKNGAASTLTVTVGASVGAQTLTSDTVNQVAHAAGDRVSMEMVSAAAAAATTFGWGVEVANP